MQMYSGCYEKQKFSSFLRLVHSRTHQVHTFNTKLMLISVPQPFGVFGTTLIIQDSHYSGIPFSNVRCIMQKGTLSCKDVACEGNQHPV